MFRAPSAHLQEDIVVYKQHMVPSLSIRVLVACRYAARVRTDCRGKVVGGCLKTPINNLPPTVSSHSSCVSTGHQDSYREWRYHVLLVYNCILLKMSTWCSKHVEESSILWINNNQCIKLVINVQSICAVVFLLGVILHSEFARNTHMLQLLTQVADLWNKSLLLCPRQFW